jgi:hypothetical protein
VALDLLHTFTSRHHRGDRSGVVFVARGMASGGHEVLAYGQSGGTRRGIFANVLKEDYNSSGFRCEIEWFAEVATTGDVVWAVSFEFHVPGSTDMTVAAGLWITANTVVANPAGLAGRSVLSVVTFTHDELTDVGLGRFFRCYVERRPADEVASMADSAYIKSVRIRNAT